MTVHDPFAAITGLPWWAVLILAPFGIGLLAVIVMTVGAEHEDDRQHAEAGTLIRDGMAAVAGTIDEALAMLCDWCNTGHGACRCTAKYACPSPLCAAPDTTTFAAINLTSIDAEYQELCDREGGL